MQAKLPNPKPDPLDDATLTGEFADGAGPLPVIPGYALIEELGRGGMGVAYKAQCAQTGETVALKVMLAGPFASPAARRRFDREVESAARLANPGIVGATKSGETAGCKYYVMPFVEGQRLDQYLQSANLPTIGIVALFAEIGRAVACAHAEDIVHRDLKPANILVDAVGNPHVLDFGLAKSAAAAEDDAERMTTCVSLPGQVLGTLPYLSPEQASGDHAAVDQRTDVYALGIMLYEALTGKTPFSNHGSPSSVLDRILHSPPQPPSSVAHCDRALETVVLKALEKEPAERYANAADLAADLIRYLDGQAIHGKRPSRWQGLRRRLRTHWVAVSAVVLAAVVVAAVLAQGAWKRNASWQAARRQALLLQLSIDGDDIEHAVGRGHSLTLRYPQLTEAWLASAHAQHRAGGLHSDALRTLFKGTLADPEGGWAYRALHAEIQGAAGNQPSAATTTRAEQVPPSDTADAWYVCSFATLDSDTARAAAERAVALDPHHRLAWERVTHLRLRNEDYLGAVAGADRIVVLGGPPERWAMLHGHVHARQGRFNEAIEQYTRVLEHARRQDDTSLANGAYGYRGHARRRIGDYAGAVEDYTRIVEQLRGDPSSLWCFYQRATPLWILGRADEAIADYREFHFLHGDSFYADARLYIILADCGRNKEAREALDHALAEVEDPWIERILHCLAGALPPEDLIASVGENREHRCEAFYYAAEFALGSGDLSNARRWFEACVATGVEFDLEVFPYTPMNEFELAQWRLRTAFDAETD